MTEPRTVKLGSFTVELYASVDDSRVTVAWKTEHRAMEDLLHALVGLWSFAPLLFIQLASTGRGLGTDVSGVSYDFDAHEVASEGWTPLFGVEQKVGAARVYYGTQTSYIRKPWWERLLAEYARLHLDAAERAGLVYPEEYELRQYLRALDERVAQAEKEALAAQESEALSVTESDLI